MKSTKASTNSKMVICSWVLCSKGNAQNPDVRDKLIVCEINYGTKTNFSEHRELGKHIEENKHIESGLEMHVVTVCEDSGRIVHSRNKSSDSTKTLGESRHSIVGTKTTRDSQPGHGVARQEQRNQRQIQIPQSSVPHAGGLHILASR